MKPKLRARKMWANYHAEGYVFLYSVKSHCMNSAAEHVAIPVSVIPLDNPEALVHCAYEASRLPGEDGLTQMRAALTAIGVLPRQRKGGAK